MIKITYQDLVARYGNTQAFDLLLTVERLAKIRYDICVSDEETRFQKALAVLGEINFAA
jgi:hypothetical protein